MKKWQQLTAEILLGAVFIGGVAFYINGLPKEFGEKQEETTTVQNNEDKTTGIFKVGDEVRNEDLIWTVQSAKVLKNQQEVEQKYLDGGHFSDREDLMQYYGEYFVLEGDVRYLQIEYTVENTEPEFPREIQLCPKFIRQTEKGFEDWSPWQLGIGGGYQISSDAGFISDNSQTVVLQGGDKLNCTVVLQYAESRNQDRYDVCMETVSILNGYVLGTRRCILLDIAEEKVEKADEKTDVEWENKQDISSKKAAFRTNLDLRNYQSEAYPRKGTWDSLTYYLDEEVVSYDYEFYAGETEDDGLGDYWNLDSTISDYRIVPWESFVQTEQGFHDGLKKMAERYQTEYSCLADKLKVLLVDYRYFIREDITLYEHSGLFVNFYQWTNLFTRDANGKRWIFGEADDIWSATAINTEEQGEFLNSAWLEPGEEITIRAAYILIPEIYEKEEALYFVGGEYRKESLNPVTAAKLELQTS